MNRVPDGALRLVGRTAVAGFKSGEHARLLEDPRPKKESMGMLLTFTQSSRETPW
jgi:hypothetical protein